MGLWNFVKKSAPIFSRVYYTTRVKSLRFQNNQPLVLPYTKMKIIIYVAEFSVDLSQGIILGATFCFRLGDGKSEN